MDQTKLHLIIMSDGTGETADLIIKAALVQYSGLDFKIIRYKNIRTEPQVTAIFEEAKTKRAIVVYTMVRKTLREFVEKTAQNLLVPAIDLLGPLLNLLSQFVTQNQKGEPGLFHQVNESYFKRIEAIEFTVKHDDGRFADNLEMADIILVGLSRTSKTPLSIYLSYKGWKVANVPVVKGIPLPERLFQTDQRKIVGLIIDPEALVRIRRERLLKMGDDPNSSYADPEQVAQEIDYCREIFRKNRRWPVFDVTNKALEETAAEIERFVAQSNSD